MRSTFQIYGDRVAANIIWSWCNIVRLTGNFSEQILFVNAVKEFLDFLRNKELLGDDMPCSDSADMLKRTEFAVYIDFLGVAQFIFSIGQGAFIVD